MFVYKLIATFRQHVYPLVSTVRKCLSICLNVFWFGRTLLPLQWVGVAMVFGGIMIEVVCNYELVSKWENRNKNLGKKYRPMPE